MSQQMVLQSFSIVLGINTAYFSRTNAFWRKTILLNGLTFIVADDSSGVCLTSTSLCSTAHTVWWRLNIIHEYKKCKTQNYSLQRFASDFFLYSSAWNNVEHVLTVIITIIIITTIIIMIIIIIIILDPILCLSQSHPLTDIL